MKKPFPPKRSSSWQAVSNWYDDLVGEGGHYYHEHVILPNCKRLLQLTEDSSLLDLACGQGIAARTLGIKCARYVGLDLSPALISAAKKKMPPQRNADFFTADITKQLPLQREKPFSHAICLLAIQNIAEPANVFKHVRAHLQPTGKLLLVLNHPCFRIPRQSGWGFDDATKIQYRKINGYMSPQKIPIQMRPGQQKELTTWSFHHPLSDYSKWLHENGFVIETIEEWCSDKVSEGSAAKWENRARKEFPLFMAITAKTTQ